MLVQLKKLILVLQTFDQDQMLLIKDTDEVDQSSEMTISFDKNAVPYTDMINRLRLVKEKE